ncbi:hypothetical protein [Salinicoccus luteus]|uniref:hypothetical protein n=1 Tax=Salinicoccus luteus TaxID=367840 RepID=UPI0004E1AE12|nr:hypothetical protein [Salinicoccus luteus]
MTKRSIALITAPGIAERFGAELVEVLPEMLDYYITDDYEWDVHYYEDILTGGTNDSTEVIDAVLERKEREDWDYAIALTDLPLFKEKKPVIAEALKDKNAAFLSLPGFGFTMMRKRVQEAILQLINEMYYGTSDEGRQASEANLKSQRKQKFDALRNKNSRALIGTRLLERFSPLIRETPKEVGDAVDVRYTVKSRLGGMIRIISGMVFANEPWKMFPAFGKIIVIAFTTGSYALVFQTLWQLSTNYSVPRAILMTIISILALTAWIILAHQLWEKRSDEQSNYIRKLYNSATFFTLLLTVIMYYVILFTMFLILTLLLMPPAQIESYTSSSIDIGIYFYTSWIGASISTIIGALGSAFEEEEVVLDSTYGYRQRQRHKKLKEEREKEKEKEKKEEDSRK